MPGTDITITATTPSPRTGELVGAIETIDPLFQTIAEDLNGEPMPPIRWVVCEDFTVEVAAHLDPSGAEPFTASRVGGEVAAKTMADPARGGSAIYLNGPQLCEGPTKHSLASLLFAIAHEATHALQHHTRQVAHPNVQVGGGSVRRSARLLGRHAVDEYRADAVAFGLLAKIASITDSATGDTRWAGPQDTFALGHLAGFESAVVGMYPTLPDAVEDFRNYRMTLDELLAVVVPFTDQVVTLAAHWQATCDYLSVEDPWSLGKLPSAPATDLYLRPLWEPLNEFLDGKLITPGPDVINDWDRELVEIGEQVVVEFWAKLGITVENMPDDAEYIHVNDPVRIT